MLRREPGRATSNKGAARVALAVLSLLLIAGMLGGGCSDPPAPPTHGMLIVGIRLVVPEERPPLAIRPHDLDGLTSLETTITRVDVVHRTTADDPRTERVITVDNHTQTLDVAPDLHDRHTRLLAFLNVPEGFVTQIRFIVRNAAITFHGERLPIKLSGQDETGEKVVPIDGVPFPIVAGERTGARIVSRKAVPPRATPRRISWPSPCPACGRSASDPTTSNSSCSRAARTATRTISLPQRRTSSRTARSSGTTTMCRRSRASRPPPRW